MPPAGSASPPAFQRESPAATRRFALEAAPVRLGGGSAISPDETPAAGTRPTPAEALLSWSGTPESIFGGMYRTAGLDLGRAGLLREIPLDPDGYPYQLDPPSGAITLAPESTLNPLPDPERMRP